MFKKIAKGLSKLGSNKADVPFNESAMHVVDGQKIGESKDGHLYIGFNEISDYLFLETLIATPSNIKTFDGATLDFKSTNGNFSLISDTKEIASEFSKQVNRYMTECSFDITEDLIKRVQNRDFQTVTYRYKKKVIVMNMVAASKKIMSDEEE
ncbi:hypothetical protein ULMS_14450 [Patiriisocius marinistellae]|uniref:Uncharacterized protein n=1 Tax=Patiriisocius marinistellae TaxID=2494560 RepID=A0A5J4FTR5_9FLAO|nr:hypothetical protein [Patiriisocius marinistellae]GEQ85937.1 hypothetical protein ULMS_14450 [Patiriisocius marinistellae]